jgi:hypothetical protein
MSLRNNIAKLVESLTNRAVAREVLKTATASNHAEARRSHLELDDLVETNYANLIETLTASQSNGLIEFDLISLSSTECDALRRVLSERGLLALMEPPRPNTLPELVDAWRQAAFTLEAARALDSLGMDVVADELPAAIVAFDGKIRTTQPQAWLRAVATYQALRAHLVGDREVVDADAVNGNATLQNARRWLKRYDDLTELLQTMVERFSDSDMLRFELEELDVHARRALVSAMDGGLCRQRQLAPQPQTRRQLETMTETSTESDFQ